MGHSRQNIHNTRQSVHGIIGGWDCRFIAISIFVLFSICWSANRSICLVGLVGKSTVYYVSCRDCRTARQYSLVEQLNDDATAEALSYWCCTDDEMGHQRLLNSRRRSSVCVCFRLSIGSVSLYIRRAACKQILVWESTETGQLWDCNIHCGLFGSRSDSNDVEKSYCCPITNRVARSPTARVTFFSAASGGCQYRVTLVFIHLTSLNIHIYLFVYLSVCLSVYLSICLFIISPSISPQHLHRDAWF